MYKAHSKDINRNKSFHPLTFENLSRVERLQEKEAVKQEEKEKRQQELARDQEERRFNELLYAGTGSADGATGSGGGGAAGIMSAKRIFAAEYEKDEAKEKNAASVASPSPVVAPSRGGKFSGFLNKFQSDTSASLSGKVEEDTKEEGRDAHVKRPRTDDDGDESHKANAQDAPAHKAARSEETVTGYVTSSVASRLRKEYDLLKKQKNDPMRRVQEFQNRTVASAAAARQKQQQQQQQQSNSGASSTSDESAIRERLRKMMEMSKGK